MAKSNNSSKHHLERFFIIFGVLFSLAALGMIVMASQQKTNTQSDAAGGCTSTKAPILKAIDTTKAKNYVVYKYTIKNPCGTKYSYGFKMSAPGGWTVDYRENLDDWEYNVPFLSGSIRASDTVTVRARVFPNGAKSNTYKFNAKACNAFGLGDAPELGSYCDYSAVSYTVTN